MTGPALGSRISIGHWMGIVKQKVIVSGTRGGSVERAQMASNAHFTSAEVIRRTWEMVRQLGFTGGPVWMV